MDVDRSLIFQARTCEFADFVCVPLDKTAVRNGK